MVEIAPEPPALRPHLLVPLALALLAAAPVEEAPAPPPAEVERALATIGEAALRAHIRFLADDLLEGRATATPGYDRAALYVASRFAEMGLQPGGAEEGYLDPVPLLRALPLVEESRFVLERRGEKQALEFGRHFVWTPDFLRPQTAAAARVVYVGYGVTAPERGYDDYRGVDTRGRLVAYVRGAPATFDHDSRAYHASSEVKAQNAAVHGAIGVLVFRDPREPVRHWAAMARRARAVGRMTWLDAAGRPAGAVEALRTGVTLGPEGVKALFGPDLPRLRRALARAEKGRPGSFALPVVARLEQATRHEPTGSPNVAALLPGSDPAVADELVVFSAHLDHLGVDALAPAGEDAIYNGAYDNASGVAALLETAHAFAALPRAPRRSLLFLAVTGEENGLLGSEAFAAGVAPPRRVVANVNLDMFLMLCPLRDLVAFGAEHSTLAGVVERAAAAAGFAVSPDPWPEEVLFVRSDQYSFVREGVPAVFLTAGRRCADAAVDGGKAQRDWIENVYHTPADELDQPMDIDSGVRFARANFLIGHEVANAPQAPAWNPGDFFGERFGRR